MDLGISPAAKLIVVYASVLFYIVTKQSNVTNLCEMWIHNECSLITESKFDSMKKNTNCTWICPKCDLFFNFSASFFADQLNLENQNRFDPLAKDSGTKAPQTGSDKDKFISGFEICEHKHQ